MLRRVDKMQIDSAIRELAEKKGKSINKVCHEEIIDEFFSTNKVSEYEGSIQYFKVKDFNKVTSDLTKLDVARAILLGCHMNEYGFSSLMPEEFLKDESGVFKVHYSRDDGKIDKIFTISNFAGHISTFFSYEPEIFEEFVNFVKNS